MAEDSALSDAGKHCFAVFQRGASGAEVVAQSREFGAELSGPYLGVFLQKGAFFPKGGPHRGRFFPEVRKMRICRPGLPRRLPKRRGSLFFACAGGQFLARGGRVTGGKMRHRAETFRAFRVFFFAEKGHKKSAPQAVAARERLFP